MPTQPAEKKTKKASPTPRRPRSTARTPLPDPEPLPYVAPAFVGAQAGDEGAGADDAYAPTAWGAGGNGGPEDLVMPSGQRALVRRPGLEQLMIEGVLHNMDNLTALVDKKHVKKGRGGNPDNVNVESLVGDPEALAEIIHTVDRVVCAIVIKPTVEMTPADPTRRRLGVIYADSIGLQDKMFLFNFAVGGSRDLERFRLESEAVVGSLATGESVEHQAE